MFPFILGFLTSSLLSPSRKLTKKEKANLRKRLANNPPSFSPYGSCSPSGPTYEERLG